MCQYAFASYLSKFLRLRTRLLDGKADGVDAKALNNYPSNVYT